MLDGFSLGHRRVPDRPVGLVFAYVGGGAAFEDAVVPLPEVFFDLGYSSVAGDAAGFPGTLQRAGEDQVEFALGEVVVNPHGALLASLGEGDIGSAGMGAG